jgi:hypothetical protein
VQRKTVLLALMLALAGCATGYHDTRGPITGWTGGYWDQRGPGQLVKVGFDGNGYIDRDTTNAYLMYHCAELAQQRNKPYFRMYASLNDAIRDQPAQELAIGRVGGKLDDWMFVLFDNQEAPGDLSATAIKQKYESYVHPRQAKL